MEMKWMKRQPMATSWIRTHVFALHRRCSSCQLSYRETVFPCTFWNIYVCIYRTNPGKRYPALPLMAMAMDVTHPVYRRHHIVRQLRPGILGPSLVSK